MSLHPDSAYCWKCNGIIPLGAFGRRLNSRCRCDEIEREEAAAKAAVTRTAALKAKAANLRDAA